MLDREANIISLSWELDRRVEPDIFETITFRKIAKEKTTYITTSETLKIRLM